jgi:hypothetical protein
MAPKEKMGRRRRESPARARKGRVDFFISYTKTDEQWAEWIAWILNAAGYSHYFQKWHFKVGGDFVKHMDAALKRSDRLLMVLTKDYLGSMFAQSEWQSMFAMDPSGEKGLLVPVRVAEVELEGLLRSRIYCDLVGLGKMQARRKLLAALRGKAQGKPRIEPVFPVGTVPRNAQTRNSYDGNYPGPGRSLPTPKSRTRAAALKLRSILETTGTIFEAQARLRNLLVKHLEHRLHVRIDEEYEPFFARHFSKFDSEEMRLHGTMRAYTMSTLAEYNERALKLLDAHKALSDELPSSWKLKRHLEVWLSKFRNVFLVTPSMSLLYVGVEERVPFPSEVEKQLASFLAGRRRPQPTRRAVFREG